MLGLIAAAALSLFCRQVVAFNGLAEHSFIIKYVAVRLPIGCYGFSLFRTDSPACHSGIFVGSVDLL